MTGEELQEAFGEEGERVEWTETTRDDKLLTAACALANDLGDSRRAGFLVLGVRDDGKPTGTDTSDEATQKVVNRLTSTRLVPNPSVSVEVVDRQSVRVMVIRVEPYQVPPIVKLDGVAFVRVGTTTRRATQADLARLNERRPEGHLPFDLRPFRSAALDDLRLPVLRESYAAGLGTDHDPEVFPAFEAWLGQRDLVRGAGTDRVPTAAGILIFGVDPQAYFPGAVIEFVRYSGVDFDAPVLLRKTVTGAIPDQLESIWTQIIAQVVAVPGDDSGVRSEYHAEYPVEALRELARNMVQHRTYEGTNAPSRVAWFEDRVVFSNPGGRFGQASQGAFGEHSDYRNPTITRLLVELGYVERLGRGIRLASAQLEANGNPPLEAETDGFISITVRRRP